MRPFLIGLMILCLVACDSKPPVQAKKWQIVGQSFNQHDPTVNYSMQISYPEIDSAATVEEQDLNQRFLNFMGSDADSFVTFIQDFDSSMLRELEGTYTVHTNNAYFLSISQRFVWAVPGTSILLGEVKCTNYDRQQRRLLALKDCFKAGDFQPRLLNVVRGEVNKQYGIGICREPEIKDLAVFALDKTGMRFFLDVYSGNHACQQIEVVVPYEEIADILRPEIMEAFS